MKAARLAGFDNVGIDLIHALPGQTLEMWRDDLRHALELTPEHLSVYGLTIEDDTPFAELYTNHDALPDEDLAADMFETADTLLTSAVTSITKSPTTPAQAFRARHNSGYWKRDGYLGLGPGAHSFLRGGGYGIRFGNTSDMTNTQPPLPEMHCHAGTKSSFRVRIACLNSCSWGYA